jgi:hypothetical protein
MAPRSFCSSLHEPCSGQLPIEVFISWGAPRAPVWEHGESMSKRNHRSRPVQAVKRPEAAEARRLRAAELLAQGRSQAEVAKLVGGLARERATLAGAASPGRGGGAAPLPGWRPTAQAVGHPGRLGRAGAASRCASSSSVLSCGVEVLELDAGVLGGEPPVDPATGAVAGRLPRRDLPLQGRPISQATVQAPLGSMASSISAMFSQLRTSLTS